MNDNLETEIRKALDAKAYEVDVPSDLATRTMQSASEVPVKVPLMGRWRAWRDSRRMRAPVTGYPRWLLVPAGAASIIVLLVVGSMVTRGPSGMKTVTEGFSYSTGAENLSDDRAPAQQEGSDALSGQDVGVVSGGDASSDATNRSADVETGESFGVGSTAATPGTTDSALDPQLVRGAEIAVAVSDFEGAWDKANDIAGDHGGDVIQSRTKVVGDEIAEGTVRMRVPTTELDAVLEDLRDLGTLASLETTGDDIAPEIDLVERKLKERKERLEELRTLKLRTTGAARADVDRRIVQTESDIEGLEKSQKGLEDKVALSIVNATISQDEEVAGRGEGMLAKALSTSGRVALTISAGILVVAAALAPLALIAALIWLAVRTFRRRRSA